ncbi:MAG: STAS domain-containing protein [Candidatus Poribacteria bacterium]|nr:STAS domain-containing protein [Candidatus Poribacteria bacterium]
MEIDIYRKSDIIYLKPHGKMIGSAATEFRQRTHRYLSSSQEGLKFLIDFADVPLVDSLSLGALMEAHISITKKRGRIAVINVSKHIKSLIVRSRLISTFEYFESENQAVSALQSQAD